MALRKRYGWSCTVAKQLTVIGEFTLEKLVTKWKRDRIT